MTTRQAIGVAIATAALALIGLLASGLTERAVGTTSKTVAKSLQMHAILNVTWNGVDCPPGTPSTTGCFVNVGKGAVSGLGNVSEAYTLLDESANANCGDWRFSAVFTIAGKGTIEFAAKSKDCVTATQLSGALTYVISGGSGIYVGASGSGTIQSVGVEKSPGKGVGTDTWVGSLTVPGLSFDTTPPVLQGLANKVVRIKGRARTPVTYTVTARDDVDGFVPVSCAPKSGRRFRVGKTKVSCSATDKSANTASGSFTITVRSEGKHG